MKNKLIVIYLGSIISIMSCSNINENNINNKSSTQKPISSSLDKNLAVANQLCNSGKYNLAMAQLNKNYAQASSNKKNSGIINKQQSQILSAYGDCYSIQSKYDTAIESYEIALQSKYPPDSGYIGITKAYLAQNNYPKAALYISSYSGDENTKEVLQLKIKALNGLLNNNYEISPSNRKLLQDKLSQLNIKLAKLQKNNNQITSNTTQQNQTNSVKPQTIKQVDNTTKINNSTNKSKVQQKFKDRIKLANNGRHYIIVDHGDTLFNIAKKANTTQNKLIQLNHLKNDNAPLGIRIYLD